MRRFLGSALMALALLAPADANILGIGHKEPTAPPAGGWNFISKAWIPTTMPAYDGVRVRARCRYVAPHRPFEWQFEFRNQTAEPMTFDAGLLLVNKTRFATAAQVYSEINPDTVRRVRLTPGGLGTFREMATLGCPGMEGGENGARHYVVMLDNVVVNHTLIRHNVIASYNADLHEMHNQFMAHGTDMLMNGFAQASADQAEFMQHLSESPY